MRWVRRALLAIALLPLLGLAVLFAGAGPIAMIPGGVLWGPVREPPRDWSFTDSIAEIQLQTHVGPLPWSVTTWVMSRDGDLLVAAGECERVWTHRVMDDPEVRIRVDGVVYEMSAHRETDRAIGADLAPIVLSKYLGISVDSANWIEGETNGCVFRLEPRG